ncbi:MAG: membrane dipeptidase [Chitinophagaceae bacterium]
MFITDAHLDLSMNAMEWNRDLSRPVHEIREREKGLTDKADRGNGMVSFPALRSGNVGVVVATQIARYVAPGNSLRGWHSPQQAWAQTQGQLAYYRAMEATGELIQLTDLSSLEKHVAWWTDGTPNNEKPIGYILSLEGADSLITVDHLEIAHAYGLRALGPAHYGPGRYANGTDSSGKMTENGLALLAKMEDLNIILDATHLCDDVFWQAMDHFNGAVWASHNNCRALVNHNRQFSDAQIKQLIQRGAIIGGALDAWMMVPGWQRGKSTPANMHCNLEKLVDHMDHICQLAGNTNHICIGTDLDGGYGKEQSPYDMDTIADLQQLVPLLTRRGYNHAAVENILHGNFLSFLKRTWKV